MIVLGASLRQFQGAVAQFGSAPRSQRGGQGFKSPQLHKTIMGMFPNDGFFGGDVVVGIWDVPQ